MSYPASFVAKNLLREGRVESMGCLDTIMVLCQGTVTQEDYLYNLLELHPSDYRQRNTSCRNPLPGHRHLIVQWVGVTSPYNMKNIDETEIKLATRFPDIEAGHNQLRERFIAPLFIRD